MVTDRSPQFIAQEIIREQLYHQLGKELPYACAVQVETWTERKGELVIGAVIVVERDSQKPIVVGRAGSRIKELGIAARAGARRGARQAGAPVAVRQGASRSGARPSSELREARLQGRRNDRAARRDRRPAERRQVDAVQPARRRAPRARPRHARA